MTLDLTPEQGELVRDLARRDTEWLAGIIAGCDPDPSELRALERKAGLAAALEAGALSVEVPSLGDLAEMALAALEGVLGAIGDVGDRPGFGEPLRRLSGLVGVLMTVESAAAAQVDELERAVA